MLCLFVLQRFEDDELFEIAGVGDRLNDDVTSIVFGVLTGKRILELDVVVVENAIRRQCETVAVGHQVAALDGPIDRQRGHVGLSGPVGGQLVVDRAFAEIEEVEDLAGRSCLQKDRTEVSHPNRVGRHRAKVNVRKIAVEFGEPRGRFLDRDRIGTQDDEGAVAGGLDRDLLQDRAMLGMPVADAEQECVRCFELGGQSGPFGVDSPDRVSTSERVSRHVHAGRQRGGSE